MAALADAAIAIGLDRFTLAEVAARVGVGESTVYNYVPGRDALFAKAAAVVFARLDVEADANTWTGYVDVVAQRAFDLAAAHPGLREYVFAGPYEPSTVGIFEALIARVRGWRPEMSEHLAFLVVSRPLLLGLGYLGDPVLEPAVPWLRRALLRGLEATLADEPDPPEPAMSWRSKLRIAD
jgi:AcrR family transcriptional regulator